MNIAVPVLNRCLKLALFRAMRTVRMTPTAAAVLQFLIDDATAPYWSLRRMSFAVGRQPRTVDDAIAELKELGFVSVLYRRRQTAVKVLNVDAILQAVNRAVAIAKQRAKAAISLFRRGFQASQKSANNLHFDLKIGVESRFQGGATSSLKRLLGLPVAPSRR